MGTDFTASNLLLSSWNLQIYIRVDGKTGYSSITSNLASVSYLEMLFDIIADLRGESHFLKVLS